MRVIACVKYVPKSVGFAEKEMTVNRNHKFGEINPPDMFAIEECIRIKERYGAESVGLCMGVMDAAPTLKHAIAMGLDRMYLLSDKRFAGSDTFATAYILSEGISYLGKYDLVICGRNSTDGDTAQVAQELAGQMDVPCITNVAAVNLIENNTIFCTILTEQGYIKVKMRLPAVISVLKCINEPRIPSISGLARAQESDICVAGLEDIGADLERCGLRGSPTQIQSVSERHFCCKEAEDISEDYICRIQEEIFRVASENSCMSEQILPAADKKSSIPNMKRGEIWVLCEVLDGKIADVSLQIMSKAVKLADGQSWVCAVILTPVCSEAMEELAAYGPDKVYYVDGNLETLRFTEWEPEDLCAMCRQYEPDTVLVGSTVWGRWIAPLVASKLKTGLTADCIDVEMDQETGCMIQTRAVCGGRLIAKIVCPKHRPQMATMRANIFPKIYCKNGGRSSPKMISVKSVSDRIDSRITVLGFERKNTLSEGLVNADIVLCGGRGLGKYGFDQLIQLAQLVGASVGATRYAVDAGWMDYSFQIGQTGVIIRPKLYICFGVSGAYEHILGMQNASCVISINNDRDAPVFAYSDYIVVDDCTKALAALIQYFTIHTIKEVEK